MFGLCHISECHILCQICIKVLAALLVRVNGMNVGYRKSGYCKGVLFGKSRPFNPRMQLALTAERFWDMLNQNQSYVTENGYLVLDISSNVDKKYYTWR